MPSASSRICPEAIDLRTPEDNSGLEPSLLIYQSDLCSAMLDDLERSFSGALADWADFDFRFEKACPGLLQVSLEHFGFVASGHS